MAWRNLRDDASPHHLSGDFPPGPLADRALFRLFTSQCHHLAGLLRRDLRRTARSGFIREAFADRPVSERDPLQRQPAFADAIAKVL
jgi:hypothetical protein